MKKTLTLGGLFAGIGGFELAAKWAGILPVWSNEIDSFCCKVLRKNFNHEIIEKDIRKIGAHCLSPVDIICGGFPCQPFSTAGKREGTNDNRYLWPEMLRVIREIKPSYVLAENVPGLLSQEGGMVFENVCTSLEDEGYEVQPAILPACATGAIHRRDRIWIVAYHAEWANRTHHKESKKGQELEFGKSVSSNNVSNSDRESNERLHKRRSGSKGMGMAWDILEKTGRKQGTKSSGACSEDVANPNRIRSSKQREPRGRVCAEQDQEREVDRAIYELLWPTESPVRRTNDGIPTKMDRSRLKALGNAIVPQVAYQIFKTIVDLESQR